jgi:hypothetical protein
MWGSNRNGGRIPYESLPHVFDNDPRHRSELRTRISARHNLCEKMWMKNQDKVRIADSDDNFNAAS